MAGCTSDGEADDQEGSAEGADSDGEADNQEGSAEGADSDGEADDQEGSAEGADSDGEADDQEGSVEVADSDHILGDSVTAPRDEQIPWARIEVRNPTTVDHGRVQTEVRFYDSEDTLLETRDGYADYLPANTVWRDYIRYYTENPERLDRVETRIVESDSTVNGSEISEASVISSNMTAEAEGGVDLSAEIDLNDATPDRVTVVGLFFDAQGRFRGTVRDVEPNPADTVVVSAGSIGIRTPPNLVDQQVESHELVVLDSSI
jgi:hypothetical protein